MTGIVGRQERLAVHFEREQISNRVGVLRAIQPVMRDPARIGSERRRAIELRLEPRHERLDGLVVGSRPADRRHEAAAKLQDDFLPDVSGPTDLRQVEGVELQAGRLQALVMTGDAVAVEKRPLRRRSGRARDARCGAPEGLGGGC